MGGRALRNTIRLNELPDRRAAQVRPMTRSNQLFVFMGIGERASLGVGMISSPA